MDKHRQKGYQSSRQASVCSLNGFSPNRMAFLRSRIRGFLRTPRGLDLHLLSRPKLRKMKPPTNTDLCLSVFIGRFQELVADFPNVAGAERDQQVSFPQLLFKNPLSFLEALRVIDIAMSEFIYLRGQALPGHTR